MPFIDSKITLKVSEEKREVIRKKLEKGAYVAVSLFGDGTKDAYEEMTAFICDLYERELGIPKDAIYVTYHGVYNWGWNGTNF